MHRGCGPILVFMLSSLLVSCRAQQTAVATPTEASTEDTPVPTSEPTESLPAVEPTPTVSPPSQTGLGLSRADAANFFQFLQFSFELQHDSAGVEDFTGTVSDGLATVHIVGPEDVVSSVSVVIDVPTPPSENQSARTFAYLSAVLSVAAQDWEEGTDWLNESLNVMGESRASFDGREAILVLEPNAEAMHVELTVSMAR